MLFISSDTRAHPFNGRLSRTTRVSQYQKGKTNLDFTEARDSEWQWHQLGRVQVCTSLQTDNHASTPPLIFTARCYASSVLAMALCLSVRLSVRPSVTSRCSTKTAKRRITQTTTQGLYFSGAKDLREIRPGSPPTRAPNAGGVGQNRRLLTTSRLYLENGTR